MKGNICVFAVLFLISIVILLRYPRGYDVLKSEYLANLKIIDLLLVIDLNFSNTLAFIFITGNYGTIYPIDYFF